MTSPAIIVLSDAALPVARRIQAALPAAEIHGLEGRVRDVDQGFGKTKRHLRELFQQERPIIGVCAAGILIRALAKVLDDKWSEPPVVAVALDGSSAVPLLGGHHGANELARLIAQATQGFAAVTTAGDLAFGAALDEPPPGWRISNPQTAKTVVSALLAGQKVTLDDETGAADWLRASAIPFAESGEYGIRVTLRDLAGSAGELVMHPPRLVLGVGCERDTPAEELLALVRETLAVRGLSPQAVACVASLDLKADEAAVHALAKALDVPARFFTAEELEAQAPRLATPSDVVFRETGCHGVSEGAALAAAGPGAELIVAKVKARRATCAIAKADHDIQPATVGRARGKLFVVGIGPGNDDWRTPEASRAVAEAEDLVGYGLYLDLLGEAAAGKPRHESALGEEEDRARIALELAAQGKTVALVCSGDAGIYALATLVMELLDRADRPDWNRVEVQVCPGISAIQAAAARAGAPINHDFCTISLSNLLTPWEVIEKRLKAAAEGDFVVAFYNPVSKRRREQLTIARDILLTGRPGTTPVILARNLGRPGESVETVPLAELTPDMADMLTLVLVGNSETRAVKRGVQRHVYTPRGYGGKMKVKVKG
ncbi:precorrin-3B C(17)-methyltransferase [Telmatospirillum sp. J64-1]|uniref:precorrin-3B C(17)-methyltransferase n=1 Tax=Telmatospirillum sp. J64-1 TaxID=2502183 RepID=UPI00115E7B32|nr:precorrin-3B C(17)-methyltransferase [Telmatospirillum sp. J64-1]